MQSYRSNNKNTSSNGTLHQMGPEAGCFKKNNLSQKVAKHQIPQMGPEAVFFPEISRFGKKPKSS